jgi:hypothetical protein
MSRLCINESSQLQTDCQGDAVKETFYGTKRVAEIVNIPEWRVKNFAEGPAYGLPPSQTLGTGRGSRRLYDLSGILRVALANELVNSGFMPEVVGGAMAKVQEADVLKICAEIRTSGPSKNGAVLVRLRCNWEVREVHQATNLIKKGLEQGGEGRGLFALNLSSLVARVLKRLKGPLTEDEEPGE